MKYLSNPIISMLIKALPTALFVLLLVLSALFDRFELSSNTAIARAAYVASKKTVPLPTTPPPKGRNIILIVVDTLRVDRLGCYGFKRKPISPSMDKLAQEGILFDTFYAASPWTAPSFASILTGVSPAVHHTGLPLPTKKRGTKVVGARNLFPINSSLPTLAELLKKKLVTAAIVTNIFLGRALGFHRGFTHFDHKTARVFKHRRAEEVTRVGIDWIEKNKNNHFFLLLHYFDPHLAYDPPKKYRKTFLPKLHAGLSLPYHAKTNPKGPVPSAAKQRFIKGAYNGEVRYTDDQIGVFVEALRKNRLLDDTWLFVTADHGEELFDHGSFEHGHRYEDEVTRLPLIIRAPDGRWGAGVRIPYATSHVDIMPTILELTDLPRPEHLEGKSLLPLITGKESAHRQVYMEYNLYGDEQLYAFFDGHFKMVRSEDKKTVFMYDLTRDPGELTKLDRRHDRFADIEKKLNDFRQRRLKLIESAKKNNTSGSVSLPEDMEKALRGLGYVE